MIKHTSLLASSFTQIAGNRFKRRAWMSFYDFFARLCARRYDTGIPEPLNYGYAVEGCDALMPLDPDEEATRFGLQLYWFVCNDLDLGNKVIVEVSSGHGAGARYVARHLCPEHLTGIDLSADAVAWCRARLNDQPNLSFLHGDAANLPVEDNSADIVINVEASHCYPDQGQFLGEVRRILKPGGRLSWADLGSDAELDAFRQLLPQHGFQTIKEVDITDHILLALDGDSPRRIEEIERRAPRFLQGAIRDFAAVTNSRNYLKFKNREHRYLHVLSRVI